MFVKKVIIDNYKCFQERTEVEFYDRNIIAIVGKNSVGKTSFLEYLRLSINNLNLGMNPSKIEVSSFPNFVIYCNLSENCYTLANEKIFFIWNEFELSNIDLSPINLRYINYFGFSRGSDMIEAHNLSSGEKNYINLMLLFKRYANLNTLFLLDEPDTFINPSLKRKYISLFDKALEYTQSQIIFTTHSCDLLADLQENQVYLCSDGTIENIDFNLFGLSKEVIKRKLFKIESSISGKVEKMFKEINKKIKKIEQEKNEFRNSNISEKILELEKEVSQVFADSPLKDELFKKLDNLRRG